MQLQLTCGKQINQVSGALAADLRNDLRFFFLRDHLACPPCFTFWRGTIRVTVDASGNVSSYNDFYPYGMTMESRTGVTSADARYKFTGKERDQETNYDYFGARYYDARIARWLQVDPLAGEYPAEAPYVYCADNPLALVDATGMEQDTIQQRSANTLVFPLSLPLIRPYAYLPYLGPLSALIWFTTTFSGDALPPPMQTQQEKAAEADATNAPSQEQKQEEAQENGQHGGPGRLSGKTVEEIESGKSDWVKVSAHPEPGSKRGAREQGVSVQEIFENRATGERVVRHRVYDDKGALVKSGYRPYYKPRPGDIR
jgi:RHS repeat-associated protein